MRAELIGGRAAWLAPLLLVSLLTPPPCLAAPAGEGPPVVRAARPADPSPARGGVTRPTDASAPVIRLFLDLQDPASRQAWRVYRRAVRGTAARLVAHPLPLARHGRARPAAHAAMAARWLGKERAFIDALLARRGLSNADFTASAIAAELGSGAFSRAMTSPAVQAQVERERRAAVALGVRATPSALLVGRGVSGQPSDAAARAAVLAAVRRWRACRAASERDCEGAKVTRGGPGLRAAFTSLRAAADRGGRAAGAQVADAGRGRLGGRWRVTLPKRALSLPGSPDVIAVWFVDPADPQATRRHAAVRAAALAGSVRLFLVPVAAREAPLTAALAMHGGLAVLPAAARVAAARRFLERGGGSPRQLAEVFGLSESALRRAMAKPAATVDLADALSLAQRVDGAPGALFLNGRRWHPGTGPGTQPIIGLSAAVAQARKEAQALRGMLASARYAHLVARGRQRSPAEADLAPGVARGLLAPLINLGTARPAPARLDAWLLVDFRRMSARAAFFALKFLRDDPRLGLRLHIASQVRPRRGLGANAALLIAARHGKGLACAQQLLSQRDPDDPRALRKVFIKIGLKPGLLKSGGRDPAIRAAVARIAAAAGRGSRVTRIFLGSRRYIGPIDENRISAAASFLANEAEAPR